MKKVWIVVCTCILALVSVAAFAETPAAAPLSIEALAAILGPDAVVGSPTCPGQRDKPVLAAAQQAKPGSKPGSMRKTPCSATASCESGTVSCSGSGTCIAVDRDCLNSCERGHVTCNGVTTWCPTACNCNAYTGINRWCCL
ncbi:MAG TPA: hypothetical protein VIC28_09025, partial [Thermoanaerobaculia bacterium]